MEQKDMEFLREVWDFWPRLTKEEEALLTDYTKPVHYSTGENLYSAGHKCVGVLAVKTGELRTYILSEDGREITLYRLGPGKVCILSASCVLNSITFDVYIEAEKETEALMIHAPVFEKLCSRNPYVENFALKIGMEKFSEVMWAMEQILFMGFDRRLAVFLVDESTKAGTDRLKLTHEQAARYMGSAREVVSRMLKHFEAEGLVALSRGEIRILDREQIKKLV